MGGCAVSHVMAVARAHIDLMLFEHFSESVFLSLVCCLAVVVLTAV
jgi:hypothetical protein